jgi:hypothetical protein
MHDLGLGLLDTCLPEFGPPFAKISWQLLREGKMKKAIQKKSLNFSHRQ